MKNEKMKLNRAVIGNVSGFEIKKGDGSISIPKPFSSDLFLFEKTKIWRKRNTWLNLGTHLLGALLMKYPFPPDRSNQGLTYFALGHGNSSWGSSPPGANQTDIKLYDEYFRQKLNHDNFRMVVKENQTYYSHLNLNKIEINHTISSNDYNKYVGCTIQIPISPSGDLEERYIIGFDEGTKDYWILDSNLTNTPNGSNYDIFTPITLNENAISILKNNEYCYIEIEVVVSSENANGVIREFGFYGGWATEELNSGLIWNSLRHNLLTKTSLTWLVRRIRFDFY